MDKAKKKIIDWLCKKYKFFISPYSNILMAKRQIVPKKNLIVFSRTSPIYVYNKMYLRKRDILEILLKESKENDIFIGNDTKILEKGMTFEQLAIEIDLGTYT